MNNVFFILPSFLLHQKYSPLGLASVLGSGTTVKPALVMNVTIIQ